jgi:hypothetical protein
LIGLLAGGVFKVKTKDGILVVEVNEPNSEVYVDGERVTLSWDSSGKKAELRVRPGTRKVEVKKDGFSIEAKELTLRQGDRELFSARLEPAAQVSDKQTARAPAVPLPPTGTQLTKATPANQPQMKANAGDQAVEDPLPLGSIWKGSRTYRKGWWEGATVTYDLEVHKREGNRFEGLKFDNGPRRNQLPVSGVIDGQNISWREGAGEWQMQGQITGDTIRLRFKADFGRGGTEGDGELKRVGRAAADQASEPKDPERRVAEWVLSLGGTVRVRVWGPEKDVTAVGDLPPGNLQLIGIDIRFKEVGDGGLAHLEGLPHLTRLLIWGARVSDAGLPRLKGLFNLKELGLFANPAVTDAGLAHLEGLANLENLDLNGTRVTDAGLAHLESLTNLTHMNFMGTQVNGAGFVQLKGSLKVLFLAGSKVNDAGLAQLKDRITLNILGLEATPVSDSGLAHLKGLVRLEGLYLHHTAVSDAGLVHLRRLKQLRELDLTETKVTAQGVAGLRKALPKCRIKFEPAQK